jgi:hypothetical protein
MGFLRSRQISLRRKRQAKDRGFDMRFLTLRATARASKSLSSFEGIPAGETANRKDGKFSSMSRHGVRNMREMVKDFPFPDSNSLREVFGSHFLITEEGDHSLANSLRLIHFHQKIMVQKP